MNTLFTCDFETGDFSQLDRVAATHIVTAYSVQNKIVRSGRYAAKLSIMPLPFFAHPGVRLAWHNKRNAHPETRANLPDAAYYSAWYYLPGPVETPWLNLLQWKGWLPNGERAPVASVRILGKDGRMTLNLRGRADVDGKFVENGPVLAANETALPVREWFEIRTLYEWSQSEAAGHVVTYLNGQRLWDVSGIQTEFSYPFHQWPRQVTWNNYAGSVRPFSYSLVVDDLLVQEA